MQIAPTRFRVPDVCVTLGSQPEEEVLTAAPFLCVEVLSPDDRMRRVQAKVDDHLGFGVQFVWIVDPYENRACIATADGMIPVRDGVLRTANPEIAVPLSEIFE